MHQVESGNLGTITMYYWIIYRIAGNIKFGGEPKITIARILADLNLAVRYGIAIRIYVSRKFWRILIWAIVI